MDKILFTPQTPEPPQLAEPSAPDVRPSHKFEGQNMGTFSGWQEESLIHPAQPQNPQGAPGYGTGPVTQRQAGPGPGAPHPFSTAPPSYLNHPMATHPQSFTQPHPSINNDVLAEIDAMGGAPGWMQRRR